MINQIKEYQIELETVGPVFIGSGNEINKKEYILLKDSIFILDVQKLYGFLKSRSKEKAFEELYLDGNANLFGWLKYNNIRLEEIDHCMKYKLPFMDTPLERETRQTIYEFVKDPYGMPYVPGSSIKGMLRTAILSHILIMKNEQCEALRKGFNDELDSYFDKTRGGKINKNIILKKQQKKLEENILHRLSRNPENKSDAVNDIMAGVRISDSEAIDIDSLILCQRIDYHVDGSEKRLPILRECLKPGTKIVFSVTIDSSLCTINPDKILRYLKSFSNMYDECYKTKYKGIGISPDNTAYLGGGAGFVTKTDVYPLFGEKEGIDTVMDILELGFGKKMFDKHKHYKDSKLGVSPHILKMTRYNGKLYHMGECRWKFI